MLYLLDASVLITANRTYYPLERVPEYWAWLVNCGDQTQAKIPREMYDEINKGDDDLKSWLNNNRVAVLFGEEVDVPSAERSRTSATARNTPGEPPLHPPADQQKADQYQPHQKQRAGNPVQSARTLHPDQLHRHTDRP